MAGEDVPGEGLVSRSRRVRTALLAQQCTLDMSLTVAGALDTAAADLRALLAEYQGTVDRLAHTSGDCWEHRNLQAECEGLQRELDAADAWNLDQDVKRISVALDLPDPERLLGGLSGGELRRVHLATRLIQRPDVLMLDEPTNHIDTRSVEWIERFLEHYAGSCVLVTHDRYFLDRVVNRIVEIEFGRLYSFPGSYGRFLEYKAVVEGITLRSEAVPSQLESE